MRVEINKYEDPETAGRDNVRILDRPIGASNWQRAACFFQHIALVECTDQQHLPNGTNTPGALREATGEGNSFRVPKQGLPGSNSMLLWITFVTCVPERTFQPRIAQTSANRFLFSPKLYMTQNESSAIQLFNIVTRSRHNVKP